MLTNSELTTTLIYRNVEQQLEALLKKPVGTVLKTKHNDWTGYDFKKVLGENGESKIILDGGTYGGYPIYQKKKVWDATKGDRDDVLFLEASSLEIIPPPGGDDDVDGWRSNHARDASGLHGDNEDFLILLVKNVITIDWRIMPGPGLMSDGPKNVKLDLKHDQSEFIEPGSDIMGDTSLQPTQSEPTVVPGGDLTSVTNSNTNVDKGENVVDLKPDESEFSFSNVDSDGSGLIEKDEFEKFISSLGETVPCLGEEEDEEGYYDEHGNWVYYEDGDEDGEEVKADKAAVERELGPYVLPINDLARKNKYTFKPDKDGLYTFETFSDDFDLDTVMNITGLDVDEYDDDIDVDNNLFSKLQLKLVAGEEYIIKISNHKRRQDSFKVDEYTYKIRVIGKGSWRELKEEEFGPYDIANYGGAEYLFAEKNKYTFKPSETGIYTFETFSDKYNLYTYMHITGKDVDEDDDMGGSRLFSKLQLNLVAGETYTIKIWTNTHAGQYKIRVTGKGLWTKQANEIASEADAKAEAEEALKLSIAPIATRMTQETNMNSLFNKVQKQCCGKHYV